MSKLEVLKELYVMVQQKNYQEDFGIGQRFETSDDKRVRSKDIRAFLRDLFEPAEDEPAELMNLLYMLDEAINDNVFGEKIPEVEDEEEYPFE